MSDLISRQAAIGAVEKKSQIDGAYGYTDTKSIVDMLEDLPSAQPGLQECEKCIFKPFKQFQPERKKGWWIDAEKAPFDMWYATCSECGKRQTLEFLNYCPNCGADMRGGEDEAN